MMSLFKTILRRIKMKKVLLSLFVCLWTVNANARCFDTSKNDGEIRSCTVDEAYIVKNGQDVDRKLYFVIYHAGYVRATINMIDLYNDFNEDLYDCVKTSPALIPDIIFDKYKKGDINGDKDFTTQIEIVLLERLNNCKKRVNIQ